MLKLLAYVSITIFAPEPNLIASAASRRVDGSPTIGIIVGRGTDGVGAVLQETIRILSVVIGATIVMGISGAIVGELLRFVSRRVTGPSLGWLFGKLSLGEGFGLGLLISTFLVAGAYFVLSGGTIGYGDAWFRYAIGAALAFAAFGIVSSRRTA